MAIPTYFGNTGLFSSQTTVSPTWAASHAVGDIALLFVETVGAETATLSTAAGFVAVTNSPRATGTGLLGTRLSIFWCRATSTSMAAPVVADAGDHVASVMHVIRGCKSTGDPWNVTAGNIKATASTSLSWPSVTTTAADCLILLCASRDVDSAAAFFTAPLVNAALTSITEHHDVGTLSGSGGGVYLGSGGLAVAGVVGSTTGTVTSCINAYMTIAMEPGVFGTAALSGGGTLGTTQTPAFPVTATLSGSGTLGTTQTPAFPVTVALSGGGTLGTTQTPRPAVTVALSGGGTLGTTQTPAFPVTVALSGGGTLSASGAIGSSSFTGTATLSGSGTLAAHYGNLFPTLAQGLSTSFEEVNTTGWLAIYNTASIASLAGAYAHGTRYMQIIANATGGTSGAYTNGFISCVAGATYTFSFWCASNYAIETTINWYDTAGTALVATPSTTASLGTPAGGGAVLSHTVTAPVGAANFRYVVKGLAVPANLETGLFDAFQFEQGATATPYKVPSGFSSGKPAFSVTAAFSGTGTLSVPAAKLGTLADDFNDGTISPVFTANTGTPIETGGQLKLSGAAYEAGGVLTARAYDLKNSEVSVELVAMNAGAGQITDVLMLETDTDRLITYISGATPTMKFYWDIPNGSGVQGTTVIVNYSAATHRFFRIRETSGTTYWETSADRQVWTIHRQVSTPAGFVNGLTDFQIYCSSGSVGGASYFDNLNRGTDEGTFAIPHATSENDGTFASQGPASVDDAPNLFNAGAISTSFEDSTTLGWVVQGNTTSLTSVVGNAGHGTRSMQVTAPAGGGNIGAETSTGPPCTVGLPYALSFYVTTATSLVIRRHLRWYNAAGTFVSGDFTDTTLNGSAWLSLVATAPATAATVRVIVEIFSAPANANAYLDAFQIEQSLYSTPYVVPYATSGPSGTATLSGSGTLSTTQTPRPVIIVSLSGAGTLSTTQTPRPVVTVALSGAGTLSTTQTPAFPVTAVLSGSGTLSTTQTPRPAVTVALSGGGTLSTTQTQAFPVIVALSGAGTLSTTQTPRFPVTVTLSGSGTLSTAQAPAFPVSVALSGGGTLTASGSIGNAFATTATLSGSGTLAVTTTTPAFPVSVALTGSGSLTTSATPRPTITSALSGTGTLSTAITLTTTGVATLNGSGTLTTSPAPGFPVIVTFSGSGTLTTSSIPRFPVTVTLGGAGTLTTTATQAFPVTVTLSGAGTLSTTQAPAFPTTQTLSGSGTLTTTQTLAFPTTVTLGGSGTLTTSSTLVFSATAALSGTGTLVASGSITSDYSRAVALSGSGTLTATQTAVTIDAAVATLTGSGTLSTTIVIVTSTTVDLTGLGTLATTTTFDLPVTADLNGDGSLAATAISQFLPVSALSGSGTLTAVALTYLPPGIQYGSVKWHAVRLTADTTDDVDSLPDGPPPTGYVVFTLSKAFIRATLADPPVTLINIPLKYELVDGFLMDQQGHDPINLVANNSAGFPASEQDSYYRVDFVLNDGATRSSFPITVSVGVTEDLSRIAPV